MSETLTDLLSKAEALQNSADHELMFKTIYLNNILVFFTKLRTFEEHFCSSVSISRCNRSYDIFKEMNPVKLKKKNQLLFLVRSV